MVAPRLLRGLYKCAKIEANANEVPVQQCNEVVEDLENLIEQELVIQQRSQMSEWRI
jgi:hypothetical protein